MDREINETLSTYIRRTEEANLPFEEGLLLARNVRIPVLVDGLDDDIIKTPIAWPLFQYNMFYLVQMPPGKEVAPHSHAEDLFRILISGDLEINGVSINVGEWFVIKAGEEYRLKTARGSTTLSVYVSICQTSRMTATHIERDT